VRRCDWITRVPTWGKGWHFMSHSVVWTGRSGSLYSFVARPLEESPGEEGGVYILGRRHPKQDGWVAICVGESEHFAEFLRTHPKRQCARDHAATHFHVLPEADASARRAIVRDLIARWHPPCNQTLVDAIASRDHVVMSG
jgi:hypothetical protein